MNAYLTQPRAVPGDASPTTTTAARREPAIARHDDVAALLVWAVIGGSVAVQRFCDEAMDEAGTGGLRRAVVPRGRL